VIGAGGREKESDSHPPLESREEQGSKCRGCNKTFFCNGIGSEKALLEWFETWKMALDLV
jgi:hypothetical protein